MVSFLQNDGVSDEPMPPEGALFDINSEVDLEITMKEQLSKTLEERIAWAMLMQESIKNGSKSTSGDLFRNVAMDALSTVESSSTYILGSTPPPPVNMAARAARSSLRKPETFSFKPKPTFLYTRSNPAAFQDGVYVLRCPGCSRTTFTSLQGLLNHARLTHNLEWGTHDECIRACAVIDDDFDLSAGIEVGIGPIGVLPGLQTIFQMAVGAQMREVGQASEEKSMSSITEPGNTTTDRDYLNETLGLHEDSPALAVFLGKEAVRRQIKVWEEDVDIEPEDSQEYILPGKPKSRNLWRMPFAQRNFQQTPTLKHTITSENHVSTERVNDTAESDITPAPAPAVADRVVSNNESRFRFIARVVITDRSMSIPKDQMPDEYKNYTHKWMISVDAPAYTHHITSVLNSLKVSPLDSAISIPTPPPITEPPFVVVGVSDRSFLAKVELFFSGTSLGKESRGQKMIFEHWVDLDPIGDRGVVMGEEQVLDVELDKHTILKPPRLGYTSIDSKSNWNHGPLTLLPRHQSSSLQFIPAINNSISAKSILSKLTKRFPMTQGSRPQTFTVPYRLVSSQAYFKTLVLGRRKAIEFGRARAIRDAYNKHIGGLQDQNLRRMSVAEVYTWLSQNHHFITVTEDEEPGIKQKCLGTFIKEEEPGRIHKEELASNLWCRICGLGSSKHIVIDSVKMESVDEDATIPKIQRQTNDTTPASNNSCAVVPRVLQIAKLPKIDILKLMVDEKVHPGRGCIAGSPQSIVSAADPRLTSHIRQMVETLGLSKFRSSMITAQNRTHTPTYPIDDLGEHQSDVQRNLESYALLALVTKSFVRTLIGCGLEVANRDNIISAGLSSLKTQRGKRRMATEINLTPTRMLTPTHILSGILTRGRGKGSSQDPLDKVVLLCLSKLGFAVDLDTNTDIIAPSRQGEVHSVKVEE